MFFLKILNPRYIVGLAEKAGWLGKVPLIFEAYAVVAAVAFLGAEILVAWLAVLLIMPPFSEPQKIVVFRDMSVGMVVGGYIWIFLTAMFLKRKVPKL